MEDLTSRSKTIRKSILILSSVTILASLLYVQNGHYINLTPHELLDKSDVNLQKSALMKVSGQDTNMIFWCSLLLVFINTILYKNWIKAKKWILEPVLFFLVTFIISITINVKRTFAVRDVIIKMEIKK